MASQPIHFQTGPSVPLYCGDGVSSIAIGCPIIQRIGSLLPSGLDAGLLSVWTYGSGGASGGDIYSLNLVGGALNTSGPYAPRITAQFSGSGMSFALVSSALTDLGNFNSVHEGIAGCTVHHLLSFRISTGEVYYYVNDVAQPASYHPATGGTFGPTSVTTVTAHYVSGGGGAPTGGGFYADVWFGTTGSTIVDLSIAANRRRFINADLTPVDLGANGQNPFGSSPNLFQTVLVGGAPSDWLINRGSAGGTFSVFAGTLALEGSPCTDGGGGGSDTLTDADLFFTPTGGFVDFGSATNRRLFVASGGGAQYLGTDGERPFGSSPPVFLSAFPGDPRSFAQNRGVGGGFAVSGDLFLADSSPACTPYSVIFDVVEGAEPMIRLSVSDDGGRTWSTLVKERSMGKIGEYLTRVRWLKLGMFRERYIKIEITDPVRKNIVGVYQDVRVGMG